MKIINVVASIAFMSITLSGCGTIKTNAVALDRASLVPSDRKHNFQSPSTDTVKVTVVRDTGILGSGCYLAIEAEGKLVARIDTGELAEFYLSPGSHQLTVAPDPSGKGLCALGWKPVTRSYEITSGASNDYRLSSRMYRRPALEPLR